MVRYRYTPTTFDLGKDIDELLRNIWNFNTYSNKEEFVECVVYEEWVVEHLKKNESQNILIPILQFRN